MQRRPVVRKVRLILYLSPPELFDEADPEDPESKDEYISYLSHPSLDCALEITHSNEYELQAKLRRLEEASSAQAGDSFPELVGGVAGSALSVVDSFKDLVRVVKKVTSPQPAKSKRRR